MRFETTLTQRLAIPLPVIQAPMGGGASNPALASAAAEAGALGFIAAAYLDADAIARTTAEVRSRTNKPWGINLFAPLPTPARPSEPAAAMAAMSAFHDDLGLSPASLPAVPIEDFEEQFRAAMESGASVFSFTFGCLSRERIATARAKGMFVVGTATTVEEAIALEQAGVDAVVAQGSEAGAHRGTFLARFEDAMVGTIALVPSVVDAVSIPVIASGGIMDGRGIVAALALGAQAVQMGTAFLTADECGIPDAYKQAILGAREDRTRLTRAFSGRPARGIVNRVMETLEGEGAAAEAVFPYPWQNAFTRPMRTAAAKQGRAEYLSLWAGQGLRLARQGPAATLIAQWMEQAQEVARMSQPD